MSSASLDAAAKKRKVDSLILTDGDNAKAVSKGSKIFAPFRTIGHVTDLTPFAVTSLGSQFVITTSVGKSFQIYDASTLHLLFVSSPQTPSNITCIHSHFHYVYAGYDNCIGVYKRGKLESILECPRQGEDRDAISNITIFGDYLCATTKNSLFVFKKLASTKSSFELYTTINVPKTYGGIHSVVHPPTYLNKLVLVTDSTVLLYNIRTGKNIYASSSFPSTLTCVDSAPVIDHIALGSADGQVHLYNLRQGKTVWTLEAGERINSLSFRTDGLAHLACGLSTGDILFYDLNNRKRIHITRFAHRESTGGVRKVQFLNSQPVFVSSGGDNLLREWVFDPAITSGDVAITSPPRPLRSRGGHSLPPSFIEFSDENAHHILSSSRDQSLWSFSLRKDSQSHEFSQRENPNSGNKRKGGLVGGLKDKFPEITQFAYQANKQGEWDNIITAHKDQTFARTWDGQKGRVGKHHLKTGDGGIVKSVAITQCGNFGIVASTLGGIYAYNLQSGIIRRRFGGHTKAVSGVVVDSLNRILISCSLDSTVLFHDFNSTKILDKIVLPAAVTSFAFHRGSDLLALALDNCSIVIIDIETKKTIREFWGHTNRITSFDFSPDARWIVSSSLDSTLRTWDLPTGGCIDAVRVENVITSLRISANGDWLATSHVRGVGVSLWTNKAQFRQVSTRHITEDEIVDIETPNISGEGGANILDGAFDEQEVIIDADVFISPEQISEELVTLSLLPRSKFNTLTHLEAIKMRNKPTEGPKKPEKAPFFLSVSGDEPASKREEESNILAPMRGFTSTSESEFTRTLREAGESGEFGNFIDHFKTLSPAMTDLEIRSLNTVQTDEMRNYINAMTNRLSQNRDYEMVQAWMSMLLRVHSDVIMAKRVENSDCELAVALKAWEDLQSEESDRFDAQVKYCAGVLNYIRQG
ncbi:Utp21-domain-containing protein [Nadsonia fulvescens var. elongata DSM 6958]|uniref:Utp21-domain-containing protein n=1 Tax=Nadsonia fulvescens var. elongata DSM 6958 TaxID=857566 RepID=A0A1E3PFI2_9ASCO|nr:Utp21-domain-containing protein [Nadsonia fulvescens var. elongata DSM 6958]